MERLAELLADLGIEDIDARTDEEIVERGEAIRGLLTELRESAADDDEAMAALTEAVGAIEYLEAVAAERVAAREARDAEITELLSRVEGPEDEPEGDEPEVPEAEAPEVPEVEPEVEAPEAIAAAAPPRRVPLGQLARTRPRDLAAPPATIGARLVAGADLPSRTSGADFTDWTDASGAMLDRAKSFMGAEHYGSAQKIRVGSEVHVFPEGHLVAGAYSPERNAQIVRDAIGEPGSLTAAGICGPVNVAYSIDSLGDTERPLRSGLPSFNASRGGVEFRRSLGLSGVVVNTTNGAIDTITNSDPNESKTIQTIACQSTVTVNVEAFTNRLKFDNWMQLFDPETMADATHVARVAHARTAERRLLALIDAGSTQVNGIASGVGLIRNVVSNIGVTAARIRRRQRMADDATIRAILPSWLKDAGVIDHVNQHAGDDLLTRDPGDLIESNLRKLNVVPIWERDGADATAGISGAQSAGLGLDFPQNAEVFLFPEGTWVHLDGGQLDFGIVRDSTLNATNQLETFFESFESVARLGIESIALQVPVCASGAGALDIANDCGGIGS